MTTIDNNNYSPPSRLFISVWLCVLVLVAAYIRVQGGNDFHYNPDEQLHVDIASAPSLSAIVHYSLTDTHPPLADIFLHYWLKISTSAAFARGLSLAFGLLLIPLTYVTCLRLGGSLLAGYAAAITAFAPQCIMQSYVVRNYTLLMALLTLCFYCYLRWRENRGMHWIVAYAILGCLACVTHFSAPFFFACVGLYESLALLRRKPRRDFSAWAAANTLIAALALGAYVLWQPAFAISHAFYDEANSHSDTHFSLMHALLSPLAAIVYLYPHYTFYYRTMGQNVAYYIYVAYVMTPAILYIIWRADRRMRLAISLLLLAFALSIGLVADNFYNFIGTRHVLWMMPFLIMVLAGVLSYLTLWLLHRLRAPAAWRHVPWLLMLLGGIATYDGVDRFENIHNKAEYIMREDDWQQFTRFVANLSPRETVVSGITTMLLIHPPGQDLSDYPSLATPIAQRIPYGHTQLLFDTHVLSLFGKRSFFALMEDARSRGFLNDADTLVFINTRWGAPPLINLMLCPMLPKKLVAFPPFAPGQHPDRNIIKSRPATLLFVSRKDFLDKVLSPSGAARPCLDIRADDD